ETGSGGITCPASFAHSLTSANWLNDAPLMSPFAHPTCGSSTESQHRSYCAPILTIRSFTSLSVYSFSLISQFLSHCHSFTMRYKRVTIAILKLLDFHLDLMIVG